MSWVKGDGAKIKLLFTEMLVGDVTGNQSHFTISVPEYTYVSGGVLQNITKSVLSTYSGDTLKELILEMSPLQRFESAAGDITVTYDGAGTLMGLGGPVEAFSNSFTPQDLIPKPDQNDIEHIEISSIMITPALMLMSYQNVQSSEEHIEISSITTLGTLTHVNDL